MRRAYIHRGMRETTYQARTLDLAGDRESAQAPSDEVERLRRRECNR